MWTGGAIVAGEYEVALLGIYGDDLPLPEANRELLPLLQRLIRLLEEGMPVLMNSAGQVVGGGYSVIGGGAKFDVISSGAAGDRVTSVGMYASQLMILTLYFEGVSISWELECARMNTKRPNKNSVFFCQVPCVTDL